MSNDIPQHYQQIKTRYPGVIDAVENLGQAVKQAGPLSPATAQLVQLSAAVASRSQGAVHSHIRRALEAGVKAEEIYHCILLLTSTIGFPAVMAALSWARDILPDESISI